MEKINPSYYKDGDIECIDAIKVATKDLTGVDAYCTGNAIKYLWRWKKKNGTEDLQKAAWYIDYLYNRYADNNTVPGTEMHAKLIKELNRPLP